MEHIKEESTILPEILSLCIVVGVLILFFVRRFFLHKNKEKKNNDAQMVDIEVATARLKTEIEKLADEVIAKMGENIDHLEQLIIEAKKREAALVARIRELEEKSAGQETFQTMLEEHLENQEQDHKESEERAEPLSRDRVESTEEQLSEFLVATDGEFYEEERQASMHDSIEDGEENVAEPQDDAIGESADAISDISARVDEAIGDNASGAEQTEIAETEEIKATEAVEPLEERHTLTPREEAVRLLDEGQDIDTVARRTGIGRGALELLAKMKTRR